jgi:hypothetical protein
MVPTAYRLDQVAVRLVERLEGTRRTFAGESERARAEFERVAREMVAAAVGEYREMAVDDPDRQVALLEQEIVGTFLPRYHREAVKMTEREAGGYGLGLLAEPIGRVAALGGALVFIWLDLRFFMEAPVMWAFAPVLLSVPFAPDLLAWLYGRRYRNELQVLVDDMAKIQDQADAYAPAEKLRRASLDAEPPRPRKSDGTKEDG